MLVKPVVTRREALQGLGLAGIGAVVSACGGGGSSGAAPTATAPATSTVPPSSTPLPTNSPSRVPSATPTSLPTGTASHTGAPSQTVTRTAVPSTTPTETAIEAPTATASEAPTGTATVNPSPTPTVTPVTPACVLSPQQTEGPFYLDLDLLRSDIREDRQGSRLRLTLQLVGAEDCLPLRDALVNVWHTDAAGAYSGFPGQPGGVDTTGQTFLRGYQVTDANGRVEFITIYPGWYPGRTVHIHLLVHLDASRVLTSQLYFDDAMTDEVFTEPPYNTRGQRNTTNSNDGIIRSGGVQSLDEVILDVVAESGGYAASMIIGVEM